MLAPLIVDPLVGPAHQYQYAIAVLGVIDIALLGVIGSSVAPPLGVSLLFAFLGLVTVMGVIPARRGNRPAYPAVVLTRIVSALLAFGAYIAGAPYWINAIETLSSSQPWWLSSCSAAARSRAWCDCAPVGLPAGWPRLRRCVGVRTAGVHDGAGRSGLDVAARSSVWPGLP